MPLDPVGNTVPDQGVPEPFKLRWVKVILQKPAPQVALLRLCQSGQIAYGIFLVPIILQKHIAKGCGMVGLRQSLPLQELPVVPLQGGGRCPLFQRIQQAEHPAC